MKLAATAHTNPKACFNVRVKLDLILKRAKVKNKMLKIFDAEGCNIGMFT